MNNKIFNVRKSSIEGQGIFALSLISKGQKICSFKGARMTIKELKDKYSSGEERIDDPFQIGNDTYIDLEEPYVFFNHSCIPNAGVRDTGTLFALRDIKLGEEITYDYSTTEWTDDNAWGIDWTDLWKIPCNCGTQACRGEIRVFSLLSDELKDSYRKQDALMDFILARLDQYAS